MSEVLDKSANQKLIDAFKKETFKYLAEGRKDAIARFEEIGLPGSRSEEYKFTPIARSLEKEFSIDKFNEVTPSSLDSIDQFTIPGLNENRIVIVNGKLNRDLSKTHSVQVSTLKEALENQNDLVLSHLTKHPSTEDPFALLNESFWREGIFIHVPKGISSKEIISIYYINDAQAAQVITNTRMLALVEESASVSIVEKYDSIGDHPVFHNAVEEVVVGENASIDLFKIQNDKDNFHQVINTVIHQSNSSRVNSHTFTTNGQLIRNNLNIQIDGEGCESHFYGLYLLNNKTLADNHTVVDHRKPNSFSNELYKGIMDGHSKGVFNGKIYVRPHAQKTNAFQSNRNILLSDTATVNTKPQLEIWADDVKCSHGCTSGQLDEEALFYLQTRGIPKETAQAMLLYAFAGELIETIKDESLRNYIDAVISERLHKNF